MKRCAFCGAVMPSDKRSHAITCSKACRQARARATKPKRAPVDVPTTSRLVVSKAMKNRITDSLPSVSDAERFGERFLAFVTRLTGEKEVH